jgi:hypothetical protein
MGGLLLHPKNSTPFLINSTQLAYLVEKGHLECPTITADEIWDKSKADIFTKALALLQANWLAVQLVGRAILQLSMTALELYAGTTVLCAFGTYWYWLQKPNDVRKCFTLTSSVSTAQIIAKAGEAVTTPYQHRPPEFVKGQHISRSPYITPIGSLFGDDYERSLRRFPNDTVPELNHCQIYFYFWIGKGYAASHLAAWNF